MRAVKRFSTSVPQGHRVSLLTIIKPGDEVRVTGVAREPGFCSGIAVIIDLGYGKSRVDLSLLVKEEDLGAMASVPIRKLFRALKLYEVVSQYGI